MALQSTFTVLSLPSRFRSFTETLALRLLFMKLCASPIVREVISCPATARIISPTSIPAFAAGESSVTPWTTKPPVSASLSMVMPRPVYWFEE